MTKDRPRAHKSRGGSTRRPSELSTCTVLELGLPGGTTPSEAAMEGTVQVLEGQEQGVQVQEGPGLRVCVRELQDISASGIVVIVHIW